jgi:hypothetical protein
VNESEFAYRVRQALDESADHVDYAVGLRLEKARRAALARVPSKRVAPAWVAAAAGRAAPSLEAESRFGAWMVRFGVVVPLLVLAVGLVGIKQWQNDRMITELAETDLAVLLDDTPIDTYADKGFGVYLRDQKDM